jgi:hypothetical protein
MTLVFIALGATAGLAYNWTRSTFMNVGLSAAAMPDVNVRAEESSGHREIRRVCFYFA